MKILFRSCPDPDVVRRLTEAYPDVQFTFADEAHPVVQEIVQADGMIGSPTREEYGRATRLRWVQATSAGVEFLANVPEMVESAVVVTNARGAHAATIAEHTFAMLLSMTRDLPYFAELKQRHEWARGDGYRHVRGIAGLTMTIVGFGNIGRAIGRRAAAFDMKVLAVDAHAVPAGDGASRVYLLDQLHEALRQTDVLAISAPITPQTRGMIGGAEISQLRPNGYLLVVSRGGIVDQAALIAALKSGQLAGAGLDVTSPEPPPADDPIWTAPNLVLTPHISGGSTLTSELMWQIVQENIGHFVRGEPLANVVDKRLGY